MRSETENAVIRADILVAACCGRHIAVAQGRVLARTNHVVRDAFKRACISWRRCHVLRVERPWYEQYDKAAG